MSVAFRAQATPVTAATRTTTTVTMPAGVQPGDVVLVYCSAGNTSAVTITPPASVSSNLVASVSYSNPDPWNVTMRVYRYTVLGSGDPTSFAFTHASATTEAFAVAYSGVDNTTPIDTTPTTNTAADTVNSSGVATPINLLSLATTVANVLLVGFRGSWDGNAITPPSGWTERLDQPVTWVGEHLQTAAGATGDTPVDAGNVFTSSSYQSPAATILVPLRPAGGSGTVTGAVSASLPVVVGSISGSITAPNGAATLDTTLPLISASISGVVSGGTGTLHSAFAATVPGTLSTANDGQGITVANTFYTTGTGWVCRGVRLYVPAGSSLIGQTVTFKAWQPSVGPGMDVAPQASVTSDVLVAGWNEKQFATPVSVPAVSTASGKLEVGYTSAGDYLFAGDVPNAAAGVQATDGSALYYSERDSGSAFGNSEYSGYFRYATVVTGSDADKSFSWWGLDVIMDDGVTPSGVTGTMDTASLPVLTSTIAGIADTGTLNASLPVLTGVLTGSVTTPTTTATLSASLPIITSSISESTWLTVAQENALTSGVADHTFWLDYVGESIPGFTRSSYYAPGSTLQLSVNYASAYTVEVWRLGWYGSNGARKITEFPGTPTSQPAPVTIPGSNGAVTCSAWSVTDTWSIPGDATPGMYWVLLADSANNKFAGIPFAVTDDAHPRPIVLVTSDATWHAAYNGYGGNNVYGNTTGVGDILTRAYCSTYDKPIVTRQYVPQTNYMNGEYATLRFLERCGFQFGVATCEQINNDPTILDNRSLIVFSGHNEYISQTIRDKVSERISAGVNVANFAANDFFWKVRYGDTTFPTSDASTGRVMWVRKDTMDGPTALGPHTGGTPISTAADWTGTWQDTRWASRQPPGQLLGDRFIANGIRNDEITVTFAFKNSPIWRNCAGIQALTSGQTFHFGAGTLGMEWDMPDDQAGALPTALLSATSVDISGSESDLNGQNYGGSGSVTHSIQMSRNGAAFVANFNTTQWGWALDDLHDRGTAVATAEARQATLNVLTDLGAVPDASSVAAASLTNPTPVADIGTAYAVPTVPPVTGTLSATLPVITSSESGTADVPIYTGALSAQLQVITGTVTGTADVPVFTAGLDALLPVATSAITGTVTVPTGTATLDATLPVVTGSIAGTVAPPVFTATLAAALQLLTGAVSGTATVPSGAGTLNAALPVVAATITGTVTAPTSSSRMILTASGWKFATRTIIG